MHRIFLDPDGTIGHLLGVIVRSPTGVVYIHECAGLLTHHKEAEGFFVPIGGLKLQPDDGPVSVQKLTKIFHDDGACGSGWPLSPGSLGTLRTAVGEIVFWTQEGARRGSLRLDEADPVEIVEGWVPVLTEIGPAVLVFGNCD